MKISLQVMLISVILISGSLVIANTPDFIRECMDCHGEKGVSLESDMPSIAGISVTFMEETFAVYEYDLRNSVDSKYRLGDTSRPATSMKKIGEKLSEAQITEAAAYFAALPFVAAKQSFDPGKAKIGEKIHLSKCEKCHANGGSSASEDAAILAGQWTPYLRDAAKHILNKTRDVDMQMSKKVDKLSDEEWDALLNYYASQQD